MVQMLLGVACLVSLLLAVWLFCSVRQRRQLQEQLYAQQRIYNMLEMKCSSLQRGLQKEQEVLRLLQEHMTESLLILDDCDKISLINNSAIHLLNIDTGMLESHSIFTLTDDQRFLNAVRASKKEGRVRLLLPIADRKYRAYIQRTALADRYGTIILLIDVTKSVQAEKIRREFTENVSHELKTPLTVIKGFGELFGSGMIGTPEDVRKYGTMIRRESERLLFLINDIIRLSEIEQSTERQLGTVSLRSIAQESMGMLQQKAAEQQVTLQLEAGEEITCRANENYLRELFVNLIDNAVKYNNPQGWVKISISQHTASGTVTICIADSGIGIPTAAQSRIFERFYRVDKSRSKERGGTGLGLSIVKHIVEYHKGSISIQSLPGSGTQISVQLPKI